jgi:esterase/lipase
MSQRDGFASGFLTGAIVGSLVGGVVGALVAYKREPEELPEDERQLTSGVTEVKKATKKRPIKASEEDSMEMEMARRSLEDKIAQLNATIDEVRQQLGNVNGNVNQPTQDRSSRAEIQ